MVQFFTKNILGWLRGHTQVCNVSPVLASETRGRIILKSYFIQENTVDRYMY